MKAAIISIGSELTSGNTVNSNAAFMARFLKRHGIATDKIITIPDDEPSVRNALDALKSAYQLVLVTGGLGPTHDDMTKAILGSYFHSKMVFHPEVLEKIEALFSSRGRTMSAVNREQAFLPDNADIIPNHHGTAQGMKFELDGTTYYFMPGVPYEMERMLAEEISRELGRWSTGEIATRVVHVSGIPESTLYERLKDWLTRYPEIRVSFLPRFTHIDISLTANSSSAIAQINKAIDDLKSLLGNLIFGYDGTKLEAVVGELLRRNRYRIAVAESCTGGLIGDRLTDVSGSSDYFLAGLVTYSNDAKVKLLDMNPETLRKYGAVSRETALEMALGVRKKLGSDVGLSSTGIAGPTGGTAQKPVGTLFIGIVMEGFAEGYHFKYIWDRRKNKEMFAQVALNQLRLVLENNKS